MADALAPPPFPPISPKKIGNPPTRESSRHYAPFRKTYVKPVVLFEVWDDTLIWDDLYYWSE